MRYYLGEAQTLVYACRVIENGHVNVIGIKDEVLLAGLPASDTDYILEKIHPMYPCFVKAPNVLHTSLENIGAMFHPCVLLFNAATIERNEIFWFYRDMTEQVASFIEKFDAERLAVGKAYGIKLLSVREWIKFAYKDTEGETLGKAAGVSTPLLESMVNICESLLNIDLRTNGRSLKNLGLSGMNKDAVLNYITHEA